jgi:hypothetical protein
MIVLKIECIVTIFLSKLNILFKIFFASEKAIHFSFPEDVPKNSRTFLNWEIFFPLKMDNQQDNKKERFSETLVEDDNTNELIHSLKEINELYWKKKLEPEFLGHSEVSFQEDVSSKIIDDVVSNGKESRDRSRKISI